MPKIIGIVGTRQRDTEEDYHDVLDVFKIVYDDGDIICSGGCKKGGDRFAEIIAGNMRMTEENGRLIIHRPKPVPKGSPKWAFAKVNYERNTLVANDSDILIACIAINRKGGTEDTIKKFLKKHSEYDLIIV